MAESIREENLRTITPGEAARLLNEAFDRQQAIELGKTVLDNIAERHGITETT